MEFPLGQVVQQKQMAVTCSHILWRIVPFSSVTYSITESFEFLNCDWRWEFIVHTMDDEGMPVDTVSLYLRRLSDVTDCPVTKVSTVVCVKNFAGENISTSVSQNDVSPLVSWRVWCKKKYYIITHDLVQADSCTFSLTMEPFGNLEDLISSKIYDISELNSPFGFPEMSDDFSRLLQNSAFADVVVKCGDKEIKAHKAVLCFRSKKFADMLEAANSPAKACAGESVMVILPYLEPVVFEILLQFIYTAKIPNLTMELAKKVYQVASDYSVESLKRVCARFLMVNSRSSDVIEILLLAERYDDEYLKWAVSSRIAWDGAILSSQEWRNFSKTNRRLTIGVFKIFAERVYKRTSYEMPTF